MDEEGLSGSLVGLPGYCLAPVKTTVAEQTAHPGLFVAHFVSDQQTNKTVSLQPFPFSTGALGIKMEASLLVLWGGIHHY